jgi:alpha-1,2-mannosyltransferase
MSLSAMIGFGRDAKWLSGQRARGYLALWIIMQAAVAIYMAIAFHHASMAEGGKPVASDFMTFWSAARMAVLAGPDSAYDDPRRIALQLASGAFGGEPGGHYAYVYPPVFLLLSLPLGLVGYVPALCGFLASGYALLLACLRRILPQGYGVLALMLSPVMLLNTIIGQNGAITASCFGGAMLLLERAPIGAGICLGLLVCKPHLAVLVPLALASSRRWRAFLACGATAGLLCAASWAFMGGTVWHLFLVHSAEARAALETYPPNRAKIQSVFSAARLLHFSVSTGYVMQGLCALIVAFVLWRVTRARPGPGPELAVLTVSALVVTPYMFDYDLTCLLVPMAWLGAQALRDGWRSWEKLTLLVVYAIPIGARFVTVTFGLPLVPLALVAMLALCVRRALAYPEPPIAAAILPHLA